MNADCLLLINCNPALEHELVDALLALPEVTGFTTLAASGHGPGGALSVAEQVAGRRRRVQFQIALSRAVLGDCLRQLVAQFGRADMRYWVLPLLEAGHFSELAQSAAQVEQPD